MKYILFFVIFLLPIFARAEVIISEIAWMGNESSANSEWIEIQNTGSGSVNLAGWTLKSEDGSPSINLSGSISTGSYGMLERTSDSAVPGVTALLTYSGALANDGEHLVLRDGNGNIIQNLDFSSGWPAGNNTTKETMQWNGSIWITASPTPGAQNASFDSGSSGGQGTGGGSDEEADEENEDEEDDDNSSSSSTTATSKNSTPTYTKKIVEIKVVDASVPVGSPVKFSLNTRDLKGANILRGHFIWNMGDGTERFFNDSKKFEHIYDHEGTYTVFVKYYSTYFEGTEPEVTDKITVTVGGPSVSVNKIHLDGSIEIKNTSSQEIDLSNWFIKDNYGKLFTLPEGTYIPAGKTLVLNSKRTRMNPLSVYIFTPSGSFASFKEKFPSVAQAVTSVSANQSSSRNSSSGGSSSPGVVTEEEIENENSNLNERLLQNTDSRDKQKQPPVWVTLFAVMVVGVSILVFFIYKNKKEESKETIEEDEFELID